ncbi:peptide-methionine (S)-S-oxide reductase MsrA [Alphaproteobacteria bacterium]|nr:peptide-methionine (S)-S-oxide reductase MsrA [Alphaproteobacteria bacterium]
MIQKALFGAGCFWGVEEHFLKINGIIKTEVGYSGGNTKNPTYERVCYENTDHAEVLQVDFEEDVISYESLVDEFWKCHDPTTLDRQGLDIGRQYRSVIYYFNDFQKNIAEKSKEKNQSFFKNRIITEISKADNFYRAEEYHQKYVQKSKS